MNIRRPKPEARPLKFRREPGGMVIDVPSELKQFTGLTDKNGVEIWEGDVIRYFDNAGEVFFRDGAFCIYIDEGAYLEISQLCTELEVLEVFEV